MDMTEQEEQAVYHSTGSRDPSSSLPNKLNDKYGKRIELMNKLKEEFQKTRSYRSSISAIVVNTVNTVNHLAELDMQVSLEYSWN